jgi:hypothetical protein
MTNTTLHRHHHHHLRKAWKRQQHVDRQQGEPGEEKTGIMDVNVSWATGISFFSQSIFYFTNEIF